MSNEKKSQPPSKRKRSVKTDRQARQAAIGQASAEARKLAGVILRVLAGELGPGGAAEELGKSPAQYYKLEARALGGLLQGCEPRPRGRQPNPKQELAQLQSAHNKLERECARLQSLVRVLGKTTGGNRKSKPTAAKRRPAKKETAKPKKGKRGRRKPTVRALRLAEQVMENAVTTVAPGEAPAVTPPARPVPPSSEQPTRGGT
ncbi:MAG: hypothetical protein GY701_34400 [Sulfitobacter sp.]|nr:hypothetical protein [Sulfitobacter sp.]